MCFITVGAVLDESSAAFAFAVSFELLLHKGLAMVQCIRTDSQKVTISNPACYNIGNS